MSCLFAIFPHSLMEILVVLMFELSSALALCCRCLYGLAPCSFEGKFKNF